MPDKKLVSAPIDAVITSIVNEALRAAAVTSTPNAAIDTLAAALIRLAAIAGEVSHGD